MNASLDKIRQQLKIAPPFRGLAQNGHAQTLLGHFLPNRPMPTDEFERVDLKLPDGDRLVGFLGRPKSSVKPRGYLHIFHGLSGSTESSYMPRTAKIARELGFNAVLWNHRGCGAGRKFAREPYHSGRSDDLARAVAWGRARASDDDLHGVLGFSLSGNATILLAAGVVPALGPEILSDDVFETRIGGSRPDFAIAISPPFDLAKAALRLSSGLSRAYGQSFMSSLLESLDDRSSFVELAAQARKNLKVTDSIAAFDACYTGLAGGFRDHTDYYERASSGPYLGDVSLPLVILSADDDPITHGANDLPVNIQLAAENPFVVRDFQNCGGHMGFIDRKAFAASLADRPRWIDERIRLYLNLFLEEASR